EAGGLIWIYMGPAGTESAMPKLEWLGLPSDHFYITKRYQRCNFLQNVEGELDSSHVSYLHSQTSSNAYDDPNKGQRPSYMVTDKSPVFTIAETPYGFAVGARRNAEIDTYYWRITQFLMPSYTMIPAPVGGPVSFTGAVPVQDDSMVGFTVTWHPDRPLNAAEIGQIESWTGIHTEVDPRTFQPLRNKDNDYLIDRAAQKSWSFTGIRGIREQDLAVQEGMGPIYDRSKERLGTSDTAIIAARRRMLRAIGALEAGTLPYELQDGSVYRIRSAALVLPRTVPFLEGARQALVATA
ncbi:MAG: aromatic ring-hydroxylating dioxygenase subunit alpha, partial [Chloroflexota bacterium]